MTWTQIAVGAFIVACYLIVVWLLNRRRHSRLPDSETSAVPKPIDDEAVTHQYERTNRIPVNESLTGRIDPGGQR